MKSRETELIYSYLFFDLVVLNFALAAVAWLQIGIQLNNYQAMGPYFLHGNLSWLITYFVFTKRNLYLRDSFRNRIWRITKRHFIFYIVAAAVAGLYIPSNFPRMFFLQYTVLFYLIKIVFYGAVYRYLKYKRSKGINSVNTLVIGCNKTGLHVKKIIKSNPMLGYNFVGFACSGNNNWPDMIGDSHKLEQLIDEYNVQMVFYTFSFFNDFDEETKGGEILRICNKKGVRLRFVPKKQNWFRQHKNMESVGSLIAIDPQEIPLDSVGCRIQKRLFDIVFSGLVMLFIFSWLFPLIALVIKINSRGPVFFKQDRTGINNKTFGCLKFRSMKVNNDANTKQATANDNRITAVGRFLRKSNLDELPQFINVFKGQMSVVGPRPHMLAHTDEYSALIGNYLIRHYVKPGITGWAQVCGYRGETRELSAMENRVEADMDYIEKWTFLLDIKIIWLTVFGKKAYENAG